MEDFCSVLGTTSEQREDKDQYKKFNENLEQYILRELQNPEDIDGMHTCTLSCHEGARTYVIMTIQKK